MGICVSEDGPQSPEWSHVTGGSPCAPLPPLPALAAGTGAERPLLLPQPPSPGPQGGPAKAGPQKPPGQGSGSWRALSWPDASVFLREAGSGSGSGGHALLQPGLRAEPPSGAGCSRDDLAEGHTLRGLQVATTARRLDAQGHRWPSGLSQLIRPAPYDHTGGHRAVRSPGPWLRDISAARPPRVSGLLERKGLSTPRSQVGPPHTISLSHSKRALHMNYGFGGRF